MVYKWFISTDSLGKYGKIWVNDSIPSGKLTMLLMGIYNVISTINDTRTWDGAPKIAFSWFISG